MAATSSIVDAGALVLLPELDPSSPYFHHGASVRVTGKLEEYIVETAVAIIADGSSTLRIDTQHLRLNFRAGSIYQFIGELQIQPGDQQTAPLLVARVGRNVDGLDFGLYRQSLHLLRKFLAE